MTSATARLRRYLSDELDECRNEDVERRLEELDDLAGSVATGTVEAECSIFAAMGNETRYRLVRVLVAAREELCVCELQALVDITESGLSHALVTLADAGLVESRKDGRWKKYRATNRAVALVTVLDGSVNGE